MGFRIIIAFRCRIELWQEKWNALKLKSAVQDREEQADWIFPRWHLLNLSTTNKDSARAGIAGCPLVAPCLPRRKHINWQARSLPRPSQISRSINKQAHQPPCFFHRANMDETRENVGQLRKTQAPVALRRLQAALAEHVEDMNQRLQAGLAIRQTQEAFEVHELERMDALLRVSLTGESNIRYTQFVKRKNELQSGVIYVRVGPAGAPTILFSDFPHPNVEVSYQDASKRLLNCSF